MMVMKLLHYFITEEDYKPVIIMERKAYYLRKFRYLIFPFYLLICLVNTSVLIKKKSSSINFIIYSNFF